MEELLLSVQLLQLVVEVEELGQVERVRRRCQLLQQDLDLDLDLGSFYSVSKIRPKL